MTIRALSSDSVSRVVGDLWEMLVDVRDADGELYGAVPVVTVTLPGGSTATPTVETITTGVYRTTYVPASSGRYVASATAAGYGLVYFAAQVSAATPASDLPTVDGYREYVDDSGGSWSDERIERALNTETSAQRAVCRVGAVYPPDLIEAVYRRIQRNLTMLGQPGVQISDSGDPVFTPTNDPEVRRLERPYRKLVMP